MVGPDVDLPGRRRSATRPSTRALDVAGPDDPAILGYTSGTTGAPKGAVLSHGNLLASSESVRLAWRWTADDRLVLALPLFHIHGLGVGLHGTLLAGASAVLLPRFDPDAVLDAVAAHDATLFFGVPTMYARLAASPRLRRARPAAAVRVGLGAAPPGRLRAGGRGQRPAGAGALRHDRDRHERLQPLRRRAAAGHGRLSPARRRAPPGARPARSSLRGPNVFGGYWRQPEATAEAFTDDGWFRTGDIGEHDADGYLRLVGRARELIITGGLNVYPREVEDVLLEHPAVAEVAVAGVADAEWGEVVAAWVVPAGGRRRPAAELTGFAAERLAGFKCPRRFVFVDVLPRNALGKLLRHELREAGPRIDRRTGRPVPSRAQIREVRWKAGAVPQL